MLKKTILATFLLTVFFSVTIANAGPFPDTEGSDYEVAVEFLYERGVVGGYPDGSFRYWQTVNRAELLKIILESKFDSIPEVPNTNCGFGDVQPNEWYTKYVCFAKDHDIIKGYPDGSFRPANTVNFVEALKITEISYGYSSVEPVDEWYREYVQHAGDTIPESVRSFQQSFTRGEMAEMITRFIKVELGTLDDYLSSTNAVSFVTYECLKASACPVVRDNRQSSNAPTSPPNTSVNANGQSVVISPGQLPSLQNFTGSYVPLFNLQFTNTTAESIFINWLGLDFDTWTIPQNDHLFLFDSNQKKLGNIGANDDSQWSIIPDQQSEILKLNPYESTTVTAVWEDLGYYSRSSLVRQSFDLVISRDNIPMSVTVDAYFPGNLLAGYRQAFLDNAVPASEKNEEISFIVNQELVDEYPNWQNDARQLIDAYNSLLANSDVDKYLVIGQFGVLDELNDVCSVDDHPEYFLSNGNYGGVTVFWTVDSGPLACSIFINGGMGKIEEENFGIVYMMGGASINLTALPAFAHEMGHGYGLGTPVEWYQYLRNAEPIDDITGILPNLGSYVPAFMRGDISDPMMHNDSSMPYSSLNAFLINHNWNHRFFGLSNLFRPESVSVKILDSSGSPVHNATVNVYGMRTNALQESYEDSMSQPILTTLQTNSNGIATLPFPSFTRVSYSETPDLDYTVKAVKVSKNGKTAGAYYSTLDLQYATIIEGKDVYEITLKLQ